MPKQSPSIAECFQLFDRYQMLPNIRRHSVVVANIAKIIVQGLIHAGLDLSEKIAVAAALLHDIGKTPCLETGEDHAAKGKAICHQHNLDMLADIVAEHVILRNYSPAAKLTEKEIVYYADKRVNHDSIVSLQERLEYIIFRYSRNNPAIEQAIRENYQRCRTIEERIFSLLPFTPVEIEQQVSRLSSPVVEPDPA